VPIPDSRKLKAYAQMTDERKPHTNIRTEQEFEDFNLTLEGRTLKDSNSGIYLRGIYVLCPCG
jgi:hypothetical protein